MSTVREESVFVTGPRDGVRMCFQVERHLRATHLR
jgi:hypothetical protein